MPSQRILISPRLLDLTEMHHCTPSRLIWVEAFNYPQSMYRLVIIFAVRQTISRLEALKLASTSFATVYRTSTGHTGQRRNDLAGSRI